jgi:acetyltransferase
VRRQGLPAKPRMAIRRLSERYAPEVVVLRDGAQLTIRAICPDDAPRLQAGMARLSPETVFRRFMAPLKGLTDADAQRLADVDYDRRMALVATREPEHRTEIVAVARYDATNVAEPAEVAIVVADAYQDRGLGVLLIQRLAAYALAHGIDSFRATVLSGNDGVLRLAQAAGLPTESLDLRQGERQVRIALSATSR